jgi:hypothetical protein
MNVNSAMLRSAATEAARYEQSVAILRLRFLAAMTTTQAIEVSG